MTYDQDVLLFLNEPRLKRSALSEKFYVYAYAWLPGENVLLVYLLRNGQWSEAAVVDNGALSGYFDSEKAARDFLEGSGWHYRKHACYTRTINTLGDAQELVAVC